MILIVVVVLILAILLPFLHLITIPRSSSKKLPPGSLGIPLVGESLNLLRAMRTNTGEQWLAQRIRKYGPISKLSLFGGRSIFVTGPAANKFVFTSEALTPQQPKSITRVIGRRNILELTGDDHKRVRGALAHFLKPEVLKKYVGMIDEEVKHHLEVNWKGRKSITVMPLMKRLTFDIICSIILGLERGVVREALLKDFTKMLAGLWAVPVNLPFTNFNRSLRASRKARKLIAGIIQQKRMMLEQGKCSPDEDLITYLLNLAREDKAQVLSEEEILDNVILIMFAGHDTSSSLLTFMIRHLASDPMNRALLLQEHKEIARSKAPGEALTWSDVNKMKHTWHVALEIMRMVPPIFGNFRRAVKDVEYGGFLIPKGWQVFWASSNTQMDEQIFRSPEKFNPTRFKDSSSIPPYSFVAFGAGPRICPGNEFARIETLVIMHYVIRRFDWMLCCKDNDFWRGSNAITQAGTSN